MGEPTRVERPEGASHGNAGQGGGTSGGAKQTRPKKKPLGVAEAEKRLRPPKDAKAKPGGELAALKSENAGLRKENAEQQAQIDDLKLESAENRSRSDKVAIAAIRGHVGDAMRALDDGENALRRVEQLIEDMLVEDEGKRGADRKVGSSVEAYKKAQEPNWVDALSLLMDVVSLFRSGAKLATLVTDKGGGRGKMEWKGKVAKRGVDEGSKKGLDALGEGFDGAKGVKDVGKGVSDYDAKQEKAFAGDEVTAMVGALDGKIDAVNGQLGTLAKFAVDESLADVARAVEGAMSHERQVAEMVGVLGGGSEELRNAIEGLEMRKDRFSVDSSKRTDALRMLVQARGAPGTAQLAKGTRGRSVFDLLSSHRDICSVQEELELDVELDGQEIRSEREVTRRHWLRCSDPALREQVRRHASLLPLYPLEVSPFGVREDVPLPPEIGLPLARTLPHVRVPPQMVKVRGRNGVRFVPVEKWQDKVARERVIRNLAYDHEPTQ